MKGDFSEKDKIKCLLWSNRHCCLCGKASGTHIEIAHIEPKAKSKSWTIDNAMPVCYQCHGEIGRYDPSHPRGNVYKINELKARRDQIYEEQTRHLVPPIHFEITQDVPGGQKRSLPDVGFNIFHVGDSLPITLLVTARTFLGNKDLGKATGHYSGEKIWKLNPRFGVRGHLTIPRTVVSSRKQLKIQVSVTVIDCYERKHHLLPISWIHLRKHNSWFLE